MNLGLVEEIYENLNNISKGTNLYKMDLHMHSINSKGKDAGKVNFNTLENLPELICKLNENMVQICAITDHVAFSYEMYSKLRLEEGKGSIVKVFPGVEFSVEFKGDNENVVVHVIAIFDDSNDKKIVNIQNKLLDENGTVNYDRQQAFSEEKFMFQALLQVIRIISLNIKRMKIQSELMIDLYLPRLNQESIHSLFVLKTAISLLILNINLSLKRMTVAYLSKRIMI